jgi:hypothetical protein
MFFSELEKVPKFLFEASRLEFCTLKKPGVAQPTNGTHFRFCIDSILLAKRSISETKKNKLMCQELSICQELGEINKQF